MRKMFLKKKYIVQRMICFTLSVRHALACASAVCEQFPGILIVCILAIPFHVDFDPLPCISSYIYPQRSNVDMLLFPLYFPVFTSSV